MAIRTTISDTRLILYRTRTSALIGLVMATLACLGAGIGAFLIATQDDMLPLLWQALGTLFGVLGVYMLMRMPALARQIHRQGGARQLEADSQGITYSPILNAEPLTLPWDAIDNIILTPSLKSIEFSETTWHFRNLIIFVRHHHPSTALRTGIYTQSADKRHCLLCSYPKQNSQALLSALTRLAPASVRIRHAGRVVFDYSKGENRLE